MNILLAPHFWLSMAFLAPMAFVLGFVGAALIDNHLHPYQNRPRKTAARNAARWSRP